MPNEINCTLIDACGAGIFILIARAYQQSDAVELTSREVLVKE
jgi:hypothetical protein